MDKIPEDTAAAQLNKVKLRPTPSSAGSSKTRGGSRRSSVETRQDKLTIRSK